MRTSDLKNLIDEYHKIIVEHMNNLSESQTNISRRQDDQKQALDAIPDKIRSIVKEEILQSQRDVAEKLNKVLYEKVPELEARLAELEIHAQAYDRPSQPKRRSPYG
ncbi:MAG: hypothetical protein WB643_07670 [Candidatus Bathyarchaeia archaeon]